jgi:hypothetical protein
MWTARDAFGQLEQHISQARSAEDDLSATLQSVTDQAGRLRAERTDALKDLARIRLDVAMREPVATRLAGTERRARELLASRTEAMKAANDRRLTAASQVNDAQRARDAAHDAVDDAIEAIDALRETVSASITLTPAWREADAAIGAARSIADEASKKSATAAHDLAEKRKPYDGDVLFTYLWKLGYGTSAYRAGPFQRFMDGFVAKVSGYDAARPNYFMLNEIPTRLAAHAASKEAGISEAEARRGAVERAALEAAGVGPLEATLAAAKARLATAETALDQREQALALMDKEREAATSGGDPVWRQAIDLVTSELAQTDVRRLEEQAFATPTPDDDRIVRRLKALDDDIRKTDRELEETRATVRDLAKRRTELERGRDEFRRQGYDHPMGSFGNESLIGNVLAGILQGMATSGDLGRVLRDGYSRRPSRSNDQFGGGSPWGQGPWSGSSGGGGSTWGGGGGGGGWSGGGSWGGGGSSGGGGGGGGGGFKTGGSF